jgi:hypothetical protein
MFTAFVKRRCVNKQNTICMVNTLKAITSCKTTYETVVAVVKELLLQYKTGVEVKRAESNLRTNLQH